MTVDKLIDKIIKVYEEDKLYLPSCYVALLSCSEKNLKSIIENDRINILSDYSDKIFSVYKAEIVDKNKKYLIYLKSNIKLYDSDVSVIQLNIGDKSGNVRTKKLGKLNTVDIDGVIDNIIYVLNTTEIPKYTWIHLMCSETIIDSITENDRIKILDKSTELAGVPLPYPMIKIQVNDRNIHFISNKNVIDIDKNAIYMFFGENTNFKIKVGDDNNGEK